MALLRRETPAPSEVVTRLDLVGARILATAELTDGWALATARGLHVLKDGVTAAHAWTDVDGARLVDAVIRLTWVDGSAPLDLTLADDRRARLPRLIHHQVQASIVHSERVPLPRGEVVRVVLRRGADGELFTQVIGSGRVDLADPEVRRLVDAAEARVRESAGL